MYLQNLKDKIFNIEFIMSVNFILLLSTLSTILWIAQQAYFIVLVFAIFYIIKNYKDISIKKDFYLKSLLYVVIFYILWIMFIDYVVYGLSLTNNTTVRIYKHLIKAIIVLIFLCNIKISVNKIAFIICVSTILAGLFALYEVFLLHEPFPFAKINKVPGAYIMSSLFIISLVICLRSFLLKHRQLFILSFCATAVGLYVTILADTRGVFLSLPIIMVLLFVYFFYKTINLKTLTVLLIILCMIGCLLFPILTKLTDKFNSSVATWNNSNSEVYCHPYDAHDPSTALRLIFWKTAIQAIKEKPVLGYGSQGFYPYLQKKANSLNCPQIVEEPWFHAHNEFLNTFFYYGIFGLTSLLGILLIPFITFYKNFKLTTLKKIDCIYESEKNFLSMLGMIFIFHTMICQLTDVPFLVKNAFIFYLTLLSLFYGVFYNKFYLKS